MCSLDEWKSALLLSCYLAVILDINALIDSDNTNLKKKKQLHNNAG